MRQAERQTKQAGGYVEDGRAVPVHTLVRFACRCGWAGCWFAGEESAVRSFDRHVCNPTVVDHLGGQR